MTESAEDSGTPDASAETREKLLLTPSRQFPDWLAEQNISLSFSTYQAGKLFLIGLQQDGRLSIFERTFNRCMGLWADGQTIWMSALYQLWRMENILPPGQLYQGYDRVYVPQVGYTTGDIDIHDVAVDDQDRPVFAATLFSCLATCSERFSFKPLWQPPFISKLAAEDRCHLNGLAMRDGKPAYVTAVSRSDVNDGWRDRRIDGGILLDVDSGEIALQGLSMPHSPRWHNGRLWLSNAGTGEFGYADLERGRFEPIAFCPGFLRGAAFVGDFAIVGLSLPRENRTFTGLPLDDRLKKADTDARCALQVIDLNSGDIVHWLKIEGVVQELYDVSVLPGVRRPMAIGFVSDEIRRVLTVDDTDWDPKTGLA
ncbi:TIGR03032 family protein [Minwuia sp.]|uniref:TIGR03032 family protein n=1 Tax=Minwuia sp. TaxID=2493630 RepID=UPI003A8E3674